MTYEAIIMEKKDGIAKVTINQPKILNCLVKAVFDELYAATVELDADDEVKVVILTGAGRAFCAGGDINRFKEGFSLKSGIDYVDSVHRVEKNWINLKKPTIAMVNGLAMGAGISLALMCDIIIASEEAKMGFAFVNMGIIPDMGAAYFLPRAVGPAKAKELLLTGRVIDSKEALDIGLVNRVVPVDKLEKEVIDLAIQLTKGPSFAISNTKRMINMSLDMDFNNMLSLESILQSSCFQTEDSIEAVNAFLEKRKPSFKGK
jgi:2-(1,2-epoxy-1,2-dihydrophenyl)acetyl-CoA isomerase